MLTRQRCKEAAAKDLELRLSQKMDAAGFTKERINFHISLVDYLEEHKLPKMRNPDYKLYICGSYAEAWGYNLSCMNGVVGEGSDVDLTVMQDFNVHFKDCQCPKKHENEHLNVIEISADGHCIRRGYYSLSKPAFRFDGSKTQPDRDVCQAYLISCTPPNWPDDETKERIGTEIVELCKEIGFHGVGAQRPNKEGEEFRISFSHIERHLVRHFPVIIGRAFLLLKFYFKTKLAEFGLKSYVAKSLMFYLMKEDSDSVIDVSKKALDLLKHFLTTYSAEEDICMPHYFQKAPIFFKGKKKVKKAEICKKIDAELSDDLTSLVEEFIGQMQEASDCYHCQYQCLLRSWATADDNPLDEVLNSFNTEEYSQNIEKLPKELSAVKSCLKVMKTNDISERQEILLSLMANNVELTWLEVGSDVDIEKHFERENSTWYLPVNEYHLHLLPEPFNKLDVSDTHALVNFNGVLRVLWKQVFGNTEDLDDKVHKNRKPDTTYEDYQEMLAQAYCCMEKAKKCIQEPIVKRADTSINTLLTDESNDTFIWHVRNVEKRRLNPLEQMSPVYTSSFGFKFRLQLNLMGYGKEANENTTLLLQLMKGEQDDRLEWPCPLTFFLELVKLRNTKDDSPAIKEITKLSYLALNCFKRPATNTNCPEFLSKLIPIKDAFTEDFCKDDTIIFRARVEKDEDLDRRMAWEYVDDNTRLWRINNAKKKLKGRFFTNLFSTAVNSANNRKGYEVKIHLEVTKDNDGKGIIRPFLHIIEGPRDDLLTWPCPITFMIEIVKSSTFSQVSPAHHEISWSTVPERSKYCFNRYENIYSGYGTGNGIMSLEEALSQDYCNNNEVIVRLTMTKETDDEDIARLVNVPVEDIRNENQRLWLIRHVKAKSQSDCNSTCISQDFLTSAKGYKGYRLSLVLKLKEGQHCIANYIRLVKGEFDEELTWPCPLTFRIELVRLTTSKKVSPVALHGIGHGGARKQHKHYFNRPYNETLDIGTENLLSQEAAFTSDYCRDDKLLMRLTIEEDDEDQIAKLVKIPKEELREPNQRLWLIRHVTAIMQNPQEVNHVRAMSPDLFTDDGYCFRIGTDLPKYDDRNDYFACLLFEIVAGSKDDKLPWPCPLHFRLEIVDVRNFRQTSNDVMADVSIQHQPCERHLFRPAISEKPRMPLIRQTKINITRLLSPMFRINDCLILRATLLPAVNPSRTCFSAHYVASLWRKVTHLRRNNVLLLVGLLSRCIKVWYFYDIVRR